MPAGTSIKGAEGRLPEELPGRGGTVADYTKAASLASCRQCGEEGAAEACSGPRPAAVRGERWRICGILACSGAEAASPAAVIATAGRRRPAACPLRHPHQQLGVHDIPASN
jgi:hypothetical protein